MRRAILAGVLAAAALGAAACSDGTPDTNAGETAAASGAAAPTAAEAAGGHSGHAMGGTIAQRDTDPSRNFALQMIEHHEGAVTMSQSALAGELDPEMRALAQKIIGDQEREIAQMQGFLDRTKPAG